MSAPPQPPPPPPRLQPPRLQPPPQLSHPFATPAVELLSERAIFLSISLSRKHSGGFLSTRSLGTAVDLTYAGYGAVESVDVRQTIGSSWYGRVVFADAADARAAWDVTSPADALKQFVVDHCELNSTASRYNHLWLGSSMAPSTCGGSARPPSHHQQQSTARRRWCLFLNRRRNCRSCRSRRSHSHSCGHSRSRSTGRRSHRSPSHSQGQGHASLVPKPSLARAGRPASAAHRQQRL